MRFTTSVIFAIAASAVSSSLAWTTKPTPSLRTTHSGRSSNVILSASIEKEPETVTAFGGGAVELNDEYNKAFQYAFSKLEAKIPEEKKALLPALKHFLKEYIGASQYAKEMGEEHDYNEPSMAAERILNGLNLSFKYGMSNSPSHYTFDVTHVALTGEEPDKEGGNTYDYYQFGCDFFRPCMDLKNSKILGQDNIKKAFEQIENGENVVFFSNHQTEADPQVISITLGDVLGYKRQTRDITFVAGHKVTTDPLAVPFSMGRNLICIHSKKHINVDPDTKPQKQRQNLKAMSAMLDKLKTGGCCLWVAPSGGRDRRDLETGFVPIAPFDSKTIDMFRLMGNKSKKPTHYYPMTIVAYDMCPPPDYVVAGVGEERNFRFVPIGLMVGEELVSEGGLEKRKEFCKNAMDACEEDYQILLKEMNHEDLFSK